ncbi:MAG: 6,7-dimethyl-8-ribityllumazine synthase [Prevotellaceae bacterium]|jgi:6,7-dimethyl-8-ribityllumazine synthase|nr:6,7-dimethyl-8-ribityllumazine synthase [Prevotellaceae bacterium]
MATQYQNLSSYDANSVPNASDMRFGIVVSEWNDEITNALLQGAVDTLKKHGATDKNISIHSVPGAFELTFGAKLLAEHTKVDAVIGLGCIIRGETPHFDFISQGVTQGFVELNMRYDIPFIFGVLTNDTMQQSIDRAGGKHGNKGDEAAVTAIKMVDLVKKIND